MQIALCGGLHPKGISSGQAPLYENGYIKGESKNIGLIKPEKE